MSSRARLELTVAYLRGRDGDQCFYCGKPMDFEMPPGTKNWTSRRRATVEHLINRVEGGTRHHTNAVLAHRKCNSERSQMGLAEKLTSRSEDAPPIAMAVRRAVQHPDRMLSEMLAYRQRTGHLAHRQEPTPTPESNPNG